MKNDQIKDTLQRVFKIFKDLYITRKVFFFISYLFGFVFIYDFVPPNSQIFSNIFYSVSYWFVIGLILDNYEFLYNDKIERGFYLNNITFIMKIIYFINGLFFVNAIYHFYDSMNFFDSGNTFFDIYLTIGVLFFSGGGYLAFLRSFKPNE